MPPDLACQRAKDKRFRKNRMRRLFFRLFFCYCELADVEIERPRLSGTPTVFILNV